MTIEFIIIIALIIAGILFLLAEVILLPGVTIAGFVGAACMIGSVVYAFYYVNNTVGYITIAANVFIGVGAFVFVIKSNTLDHMALKTDIDAVVEQPDIQHLSVGEKGLSLSRLNPIGNVEFNQKYIVEARSITGEFIDAECIVEIVRIENTSVYVKSATETT